MRFQIKSPRALFVAILLTLPALMPIIKPGYFPIHDNTQVVRVAQMTQALKDGHFPVRWVKDLGYGFGYPIFNFYNPLPYYFGSLVNLVGFNALTATKAMFALPIFAAALTMFILTRSYLGKFGAVVASVFYTYAPYHAVQVYVRGAVAEYWAYALLPLIVYFLLQKKLVASAISIALLILSHNLTSLMTIQLISLIFIIQLTTEKPLSKVIKRYALIAGLALGTSAFFWFPALAEQGFTSVSQMVQEQFNPLDHFVYPDQFWSWPWGYGGSAPGRADGLSFTLGKFHLVVSILALVFAKKIWQKQNNRQLYIFSIFIFIFALFMMTSASQIIWQSVSLLDFIQFPWRHLAFAALGTSILAGFSSRYVYSYLRSQTGTRDKLLLAGGYLSLVIFIAISAKKFQASYKYGDVTVDSLLEPDRIKFEVSSRSDEYRPLGAERPDNLLALPKRRYQISLEEEESIKVLEDKTQTLVLQSNLQSSKPLIFNIYSFPGWKTLIDNNQVSYQDLSGKRLMQITVPKGTHTLTAKFKNTPVRTLANMLSLVSLGALLIIDKKKLYE